MTKSDVQFATVFLEDNMLEFVESVRTAEEVGFDVIGYADSQTLWGDAFVALTLAAQHTQKARIGTMVLNPATRHPVVSACGLATIQQLAEGRAFCGIGSGDSAVRNISTRASTVSELEAYATSLKGLCAGNEVEWQGQSLQMRWQTDPVPVWLSAEGPRTLDLAGRIADGVIVGNGITPEVIKDSIERVRRGALAVGRDPDEIEMWWMVKPYFSPSAEQGWRELDWSLAGGNKTFRQGLDNKFVPDAIRERILGLVAEYDSAEHARRGSHNAKLVEKYDLYEFLGQRFTVCGPPAQIVEGLQEIVEAGARNLVLIQLVPDKLALMRKLAEEIFPAFR